MNLEMEHLNSIFDQEFDLILLVYRTMLTFCESEWGSEGMCFFKLLG